MHMFRRTTKQLNERNSTAGLKEGGANTEEQLHNNEFTNTMYTSVSHYFGLKMKVSDWLMMT